MVNVSCDIAVIGAGSAGERKAKPESAADRGGKAGKIALHSHAGRVGLPAVKRKIAVVI